MNHSGTTSLLIKETSRALSLINFIYMVFGLIVNAEAEAHVVPQRGIDRRRPMRRTTPARYLCLFPS